MDHFDRRDGELWCEGVPLKAIAEAVGTPVYVYSAATMVRHARVLRAAVAQCGQASRWSPTRSRPTPTSRCCAYSGRRGSRRRRRLGRRICQRARGRRPAGAHRLLRRRQDRCRRWRQALEGGLCQFNLESVEEARNRSQRSQRRWARLPRSRFRDQSRRRRWNARQDLHRHGGQQVRHRRSPSAIDAYARSRDAAGPRRSQASPSTSAAS